MRYVLTAILALVALLVVGPSFGQETTKTFTFKKTKQADLAIHVHFPPDWKKEDKRPAIVFFFGGGFQFGDVSQFVPQAAYFASRGMVAARADYRVKSRHGVEPDACVEDAKSAVRWLRQNAAKLGIDESRLVACGSSSGGYLAASTACPGLEPEGEDQKISSKANALILFNPFLPFVKEKATWKIVPTVHLTKDTPPTLILFGTTDALLLRADEFMAKSKEVGHKAEIFLAEGVGHGFAGKSPWREKVIQREDEFLVSLGYLQGKPTIKVPDGKDVQPRKDPPKHFTNSIGMKFVWIPPGSFMMGSPKEEKKRQDNETQHKVTLSKGFYMGVYTVTQEQWQAVMGDNPSNFNGEKSLPVEKVSWDDCQEFIKKLREKDKDKKAYRLPTEAEWEYACRAGTKTPFHFGETISTDQANYNGNYIYGDGKKGMYREKTTPVGSFPANVWGFYDMHGNVWQWCEDWYADYPQKDVVDPQGPEKGQSRVLRGGSWRFPPESCRSALRDRYVPGLRINFIGFRLCFSME
jgi:formylglycine-generating enzyme required for sulfatase activity